MIDIKKFSKENPKQTLLNVGYILFVISLFGRFFEQLFSTYGIASVQISEFLINYQGGFVRRGLMGEILFFFAKNFNINLEWTVKIFCLICLVFVCVFFVRSFWKKGYTLYILPLCFFIGGDILTNWWIRKDYLFICFFIAIFWIYNKSNLLAMVKFLIINILTIFILLSHEAFAFFAIPILFLLLFNQYKDKGITQSCIFSLLYLLPSVLAFLSTLVHHGNQEIAQTIQNSWNIILNKNLPDLPAVTAIAWESKWAFKHHFNINFFSFDHGIYSSLVWIITIPIVYYIVTNALLVFRKSEKDFTNRQKTVLSSVLIFQILCLLPVFTILSCDYIRVIFYWIASSFVLFLLVPIDRIEKLFPAVFINIVERINKGFKNILSPTKTTLVFLMMSMGISGCYFVIESVYRSTMLYNILSLLSRPFYIILKCL